MHERDDALTRVRSGDEMAALLRGQAGDLKTKVGELQSQLDGVTRHSSTVEMDAKQKQSTLQQLMAERNALQSSVDELTHTAQKLREEKAQLGERVARLSADVSAMDELRSRAENATFLQGEVKRLQSSRAEAQEAADAERSRRVAAEEECSRQADRTMELDARVDQLRRTIPNAEQSQAELQERSFRIDHLQREVDRLFERNTALEEQIMEAKSASHGSEKVLHASAKEVHGEVHVLMRWISQVLSGGTWPACPTCTAAWSSCSSSWRRCCASLTSCAPRTRKCRAAWPRLWRRRRTSRA